MYNLWDHCERINDLKPALCTILLQKPQIRKTSGIESQVAFQPCNGPPSHILEPPHKRNDTQKRHGSIHNQEPFTTVYPFDSLNHFSEAHCQEKIDRKKKSQRGEFVGSNQLKAQERNQEEYVWEQQQQRIERSITARLLFNVELKERGRYYCACIGVQ